MAKAKFIGVHSSRAAQAGAGGKSSDGQRKQYWFVWLDGVAKTYLIQQLDDKSFEPVSKPRLLSADAFRQSFTRESRITLIPTIQPEVGDYLDKAFAPKKSDKYTHVTGKVTTFSAPPKEKRKVESPEEVDKNARTEFAKNIMRFQRGNTASAVEAFQRLADLDEGIVPAHKHMFTDFGVDLRKNKLYDVALRHFQRAVALSPDDSHAHFNVARIFYEQGRFTQALEHLKAALELEPDLHYARLLMERIRVQMEAFTAEEF